MSLDQIHIGVTAVVWFAGLLFIAATLPKVSAVRRATYVVALPLWVGWTLLYGYAFFTYSRADAAFTMFDIVFRVMLFGIACEGILVPLVDRLELRQRVQQIRIKRSP